MTRAFSLPSPLDRRERARRSGVIFKLVARRNFVWALLAGAKLATRGQHKESSSKNVRVWDFRIKAQAPRI
jgi:hypothetical protein